MTHKTTSPFAGDTNLPSSTTITLTTTISNERVNNVNFSLSRFTT